MCVCETAFNSKSVFFTVFSENQAFAEITRLLFLNESVCLFAYRADHCTLDESALQSEEIMTRGAAARDEGFFRTGASRTFGCTCSYRLIRPLGFMYHVPLYG